MDLPRNWKYTVGGLVIIVCFVHLSSVLITKRGVSTVLTTEDGRTEDRPNLVYQNIDEKSEVEDAEIKHDPSKIANRDSNSIWEEGKEENLLNVIRGQFVEPSGTPAVVQRNSTHFSQAGQSEFVDGILNKRSNGFFVECGAANGVMLSNSMFFEKFRNWTGLLVEANPDLYKRLVKVQRNAYSINACLSPTLAPSNLTFEPAGLLGGISDLISTHKKEVAEEMKGKNPIEMQCFSLYHMMRALNRSHIDYFSLDVEGAELNILRTIPFDKLTIDVLTVEYNSNQKRLDEYKAVMDSSGLYRFLTTLPTKDWMKEHNKGGWGLDAVFVRKDADIDMVQD